MQITYLAIQGGTFPSRNVHVTNKSLYIYFPTYFNLSQHLLITKISNVIYHSTSVMKLISNWVLLIIQGKSEGIDSCDRPSNLLKLASNCWFFSPYNLEICRMTSKTKGTYSMLHQALCTIIPKPLVNSNWSYSPETLNWDQNWQVFYPVWPWNLMDETSHVIGHLSYAT